jgi:hypothetical protein
MASIKQIVGVIAFSVILLGVIAWWVDKNNQPPEILLGDEVTLEGPLSPEELEIYNPEITNTMKKLIAAFTIFDKYIPKEESPCGCERDTLYVYCDPNIVSEEDKNTLEGLGFYPEESLGYFISGI